jgi:PKD repeat protein
MLNYCRFWKFGRAVALFLAVMLFLTFLPLTNKPVTGPGDSPETVLPDISSTSIGLAFSENLGQVKDSSILFYAPSGGAAFGQGSMTLLSKAQANGNGTRGSSIRLSFVGSEDAVPVGSAPTQWRSNYFLGNDRSSWITQGGNYHNVVYNELWNGIDLVYRMTDGGLKYDFLVAPGSDHGQIRIKATGHESLSVTDDGSLKIATGLGPGTEIIDSGLDVFYADEPSQKLRAGFILMDADTYGFSISGRDPARAIVIDPLIRSTYLGGAGTDRCLDIATDAEGNSYMVGITDSANFPTTLGVFETAYNGYTYDIFVAKLNPAGDSLLYSTYLGDEGEDRGLSIAVDGSGNAYITGHTNSNEFPTTAGAMDRTYNGDAFDAFVTKLGPAGDTLVYSTFLGGTRVDIARGIAIDASGYAYIVGDTWSYDFPITPDAVNRVFNGGETGANDAFVTKLSQSGSAVVYSTFIGHADYDYGNDIAVDSAGQAYIVGSTRSKNFPTSPGAFDRSHNGGYDVFVAKLTRTGTAYSYLTLLGGSSSDYGTSIALDAWGDAHITGYTQSTNFPTTANAFSTTHSGWVDAFVVKLTKYGGTLAYSTLVGGTEGDYGYGIAVDSAGRALVTGATSSSDFPVTALAHDPTYSGSGDAFVLKVSPGGDSLMHSTYLGSFGTDIGNSIAIDANGYTVIAGETTSTSFPSTYGALDATFNGVTDAFISVLDFLEPIARAGPDISIPEGAIAHLNGRDSIDNHRIVNYTWKFHDGTANVTLYNVTNSHLFMLPGIYDVTLSVLDFSGLVGTDIVLVNVLDTTLPVAEAGPDRDVNESTIVVLDGSASTDNVGIVNHTWTFAHGGRNVALYGPNRSFKFTVPGIYPVLLTVSDAAGNSDTDGLTVIVRDITRPLADAGRNRTVRRNSELALNGSASYDNVGIVNYTWTFNDGTGNVRKFGPTPFHTFTVEGVYLVTLTVWDAVGQSDSDTTQVTVLEIIPPVASAGPDISVDEMAVMRFDGSASTDNVGVALWAWSFNDGLNDVTLFGVSPEWIFTVPGVYEVTLDVSDAAGNTDTAVMRVTVIDVLDPVPMPGRNIVSAAGIEVAFDGSGSRDSSGIATHTWSFMYNGTETVLEGSVTSFVFWTPGIYTVTLTVTDTTGRSASSVVTVAVLQSGAEQESATDNLWIYAAASFLMLTVAVYVWSGKRRRVAP